VPQGHNLTMTPLLYVRQSVLTCQTGVSSSYTYTENSIGRIRAYLYKMQPFRTILSL